MQPNEQARRGRSGPAPQQYANAVVSERIDSVVYGFLRRSGYHNAANAMEQESPFIPTPDGRRVVTINDRIHEHTLEDILTLFEQDGRFGVNQNLLEFGEELRRLTNRFTTITAQSAPGRSTIHQQLYGRPAYSRAQTYQPAPQARAQMELARIAQIGEMRFREEQEQRQRAQQQQQYVQQQQQPQQMMMLQPPPQIVQAAMSIPITPVAVPPQHLEDGELVASSQSAASVASSSRRKLHHPQSLNSFVRETVIEPIVGLINERTWNDLTDIQIDDGTAICDGLEVIGKDFLATFDYNPEEMNHQQSHFDPVFDEIMDNYHVASDQQLREHPEIQQQAQNLVVPIAEDVVMEEIPRESSSTMKTARFPEPSPLLSPLPRDLSFRKPPEPAVVMSVTTVPAQPPIKIEPRMEPPAPAHAPAPSASRPNPVAPRFQDLPPIPRKKPLDSERDRKEEREREKERERRDRHSEDRSSRNDSSPSRRSVVVDRRNEEKKRLREKERDREREKSTHRDRENEKRKEERPHATSSRRFSSIEPSTSNHRSSYVQNDRESDVSASASRKESERRWKEKEERKEVVEKERERAKEKEKEKEKQRPLPIPPSNNQSTKVTNDFLNKVRKAQASTSSTSTTSVPSSSYPSLAPKRKADEMKMDFKIPKKPSTSTSIPLIKPPDSRASYGSALQSGPLIREMPSSAVSTSSSKSEKSDKTDKSEKASKPRKKLQKAPAVELYSGDREDTTHFLGPRGHLARLTALLINSGKKFEEKQEQIKKAKEKQLETEEKELKLKKKDTLVDDLHLSDASLSPPVSANSETSSAASAPQMAGPSTAPMPVNQCPKTTRQMAPRKGYMLTERPNMSSPAEESSCDETSTAEEQTDKEATSSDEEEEEEGEKNGEPPKKRRPPRKEYGESVEPRKSHSRLDMNDIEHLMNRIHGGPTQKQQSE
ncbi:unnamed protein product [Caenorhabditis sp. 36 PRJEB53466]|nr:unnamed protein product [Caenorhabditis sp. 36 PRJEB53466]